MRKRLCLWFVSAVLLCSACSVFGMEKEGDSRRNSGEEWNPQDMQDAIDGVHLEGRDGPGGVLSSRFGVVTSKGDPGCCRVLKVFGVGKTGHPVFSKGPWDEHRHPSGAREIGLRWVCVPNAELLSLLRENGRVEKLSLCDLKGASACGVEYVDGIERRFDNAYFDEDEMGLSSSVLNQIVGLPLTFLRIEGRETAKNIKPGFISNLPPDMEEFHAGEWGFYQGDWKGLGASLY